VQQNKLFWNLPHELRRTIFNWQDSKEFSRLSYLRTANPTEKSAPTFLPFLETKSIFVHIPKAAGISVGYSLYGRHTGNHTTIAEYQIAFTKSEFESCFKFAFVRNPWDRLLSAYLFLKKGGRNKGDAKWAQENLAGFKNFEEFVLQWVTPKKVLSGIHFVPQHKFVTQPFTKNIMVDFVGRYENLAQDFNVVREKLGFGKNLLFENKTEVKIKDYRDFYSEDSKAIVAEVYREDIELFGYKFE